MTFEEHEEEYKNIGKIAYQQKELFNSAHFQHTAGEMGSRSLQRLLVLQLSMNDGENVTFIINDWINVQEARYRFIAIDDMGKKIIRIVIDEFFGCEVIWEDD